MNSITVVVYEDIRTIAATGVIMVPGARLGCLATQPALGEEIADGRECWSITHVPTGMRLGSYLAFYSETDALNFIRVLAALPIDWSDARNIRKNDVLRAVFDAAADFCGGFQVERGDKGGAPA